MQNQTVYDFFNQLHIGIDVDFCKTNPGRISYWKAIDNAVSIPLMFKQKGFDHWRIRIQEYDLSTPHPITGRSLLNEIHGVTCECVDVGLMAIVAFQGEAFKLNPVNEEIDRVVEWWKTVALKFKRVAKEAIAFNLIIETTGVIPDLMLNSLYEKAYLAIQAIDPGRVCIVCPNRISAPERLPQLIVPGEFCFVESHLYASGINPTDPNKLWTTGTRAEKNPLINKLNLMQSYSDRTDIPVWIGAILSGDYNKDDNLDQSSLLCSYTPREQAEFIRWFMSEAIVRGIPVAWNSDTKVYDRDVCDWVEFQSPLVEAMMSK